MLVDSWAVAGITVVNVIVLLTWIYRARRFHDMLFWLPIALLVPMIYLTILYITVDTLDLQQVQLYGRDGFFVLLVCNAIVYSTLATIAGGKRGR